MSDTSADQPDSHAGVNSTDNQPTTGTRERAGSSKESIGDILSRPDVKHQIKYAVGIFGIVGLGFGLTGFVFTDILIPGVTSSSGSTGSTGSSLFGGFLTIFSLLSILVLAALSGPILGVISALRVDEAFDTDRVAYVTSASGNVAGYVVMLVVTVLMLSVTGSTGGGSSTGDATGGLFNLGDLLVPFVALSIPVGVVGALTVYLRRELI